MTTKQPSLNKHQLAKFKAIARILKPVTTSREERESLALAWLEHPIQTFYLSYDAGFIQPDQDNPVLKARRKKKSFNLNSIRR